MGYVTVAMSIFYIQYVLNKQRPIVAFEAHR